LVDSQVTHATVDRHVVGLQNKRTVEVLDHSPAKTVGHHMIASVVRIAVPAIATHDFALFMYLHVDNDDDDYHATIRAAVFVVDVSSK
jgi:hypothetical protein